MAPRRNPAVPAIDPAAVIREFTRSESVLLEIVDEEAAKLVAFRKDAGKELATDHAVSQGTRLRMNSSIKSIILPFEVPLFSF